MYSLLFWFLKRLIVAERLDTFKDAFLVLCFPQVMALCVSHGHLHDCYISCCCHSSCNCKLKRTKKLQQFLVYIQKWNSPQEPLHGTNMLENHFLLCFESL